MPRVAVNIVTHNSADRLGACLAAVFGQQGPDLRVVVTVVDNASTDDTLARLAPWQAGDRGVRFIANPDNRLYARAHNQALRATDAAFVLTLNPDVLLTPNFLTNALAPFADAPRVGAVNGKLLLVAPDAWSPALLDAPPDPNATIDGAGLTIRRSRRPYLRGNRQPAAQACRDPAPIFGADGAAALYRRAMLDDVAVHGEVLDEDFAIYREDVDLAWRAQLLGWDTCYAPDAVGYHVRGFHLGQPRRAIPAPLKRHSVKNGWLLLLKNEDAASLLRALPWVLPYQLKILGGLLLTERSSLGAIADTLRLLPRIRHKRALTLARRRRSPTEMRGWFR